LIERSGIVADAELCSGLAGVSVTCRDADGTRGETGLSDEQGRWRLAHVEAGDEILFEKGGFVSKVCTGEELSGVVRMLEDRLIGYQDRLWYLPGEEVAVRVHSPCAFRACLCRHGLTKETILRLGRMPAHRQQVPNGHFVATGVDWPTTFSYRIPETARPGLYSLLLEAEGQKAFAVPFTVSTPPHRCGKSADIVVLANTTTWQSYNVWGGRSRYRNCEGRGEAAPIRSRSLLAMQLQQFVYDKLPAPLRRAARWATRRRVQEARSWQFDRLSVRRPFTNCRLEGADVLEPFCNHLGAAEWRVLAWMEREGIAYDIVSGFDLDRRPDVLGAYKAILFSSHCEYWTRGMYATLKHHHTQRGLWVLNFAGNTLYRLVEFFDDGSTRCRSLSFNDAVEDETQLLGVRVTAGDYATCAPYRVVDRNHWVFANARLRGRRPRFGQASLNRKHPALSQWYDPGRPGLDGGLRGAGASGWETDKLSRAAPADVRLVAKGMNRFGGADMVVREPAGTRGGMFSASSVCFGGCLLIDETASIVARNVIDRALAPVNSARQ